jgi:hypothetical protein
MGRIIFNVRLRFSRREKERGPVEPDNVRLTGGVLQLRYGLPSAARSAAFGGFLLALIEGVSIALTRLTSNVQGQQPDMVMAGINDGGQGVQGGEQAVESGGIWQNIFGAGRDDGGKTNDNKNAEPVMPKFKEELD